MFCNNELIFQHRAKDKDTYPDLLDATAGGYVDLGETYEDAALKELFEETGIRASIEDLTFLQTTTHKATDEVTGLTNHPLRNVYLLKKKVEIDDLKIEEGKALDFEGWPVEKLFNLTEGDKKKFIPTLLDEKGFAIFKMIQERL